MLARLLGQVVGAVPQANVAQGGCQVRAGREAFQGQLGCR